MTPSLSQVLLQGGAAAHPSLNPLFLLAGITVFFLAAFSAVKGLEVFRRRLIMPRVLDEAPSLAEIRNKEKLEKLTFMVDEIKSEKENLAVQNSGLQGKIQELNHALMSVKQTRDTLEKSNAVFLKESARLKAEKEELILRTSEPLIGVKTGAKAVPAVVKQDRAKTSKTMIKAKKRERGKPVRVRKKIK